MTEAGVEERVSAIARARSSRNADEIVDGVKTIVGAEIAALSPDAKVVSTSYYNHTYMPDFVVEWRDRGKLTARPVFIRNNFTPSSVAREVESLANREPVVLGLDSIGGDDHRQVRSSLDGSSSRMLFSDVASMGRLADTDDGPDSSPLLTLVRSNILRGGRGVLGEDEAQTVTDAADLSFDSESEAQLDSFAELASSLFEEASATRLLRAAEILRLSVAAPEDGDAVFAAFGGDLSDTDLKVLLPYLLKRQDQISNPQFWGYIGSMISLGRLEEFASYVESSPITPLVIPNLETWRAKRVQLSLNSRFDEDEDDGRAASWVMQSGLLTAVAGRYLLSFAADARRIKGRDGRGGLPRWESLEEIVGRYRLDEVHLRGVVSRIRISAEESGDVARDTGRINETLDDSFNVDSAAVRRIAAESEEPMRVAFAESLVTGDRSETILDLAETALDFLAYGSPLEARRRDELLGLGGGGQESSDEEVASE